MPISYDVTRKTMQQQETSSVNATGMPFTDFSNVCIFAVGIMTVTPFVPSVDAHPAEVWWNYHLIVCSEYDGHYYTYCAHVRQVRLGYAGNDTPHPHEQKSRPDEYTSELKTVNNCNECNL